MTIWEKTQLVLAYAAVIGLAFCPGVTRNLDRLINHCLGF